jgi:thiamine-phosphate pyrophosphorylase
MSLVAALRLMVLTDPGLLLGREAVDVCRRARAGGATVIQVRWKTGTPADMAELARALVTALDVPVLVNDRVDVALAAGAAGVHLGWDDLPLAAARAIVPPGFILGLSVGSADEASRARSLPADYWSVGPCFGTTTKPDAGAALGAEGFGRLARLAPGIPVIGIGGITTANVASIRRAGASGVAVAGAVFGASDPTTAAAALVAAGEGA